MRRVPDELPNGWVSDQKALIGFILVSSGLFCVALGACCQRLALDVGFSPTAAIGAGIGGAVFPPVILLVFSKTVWRGE